MDVNAQHHAVTALAPRRVPVVSI